MEKGMLTIITMLLLFVCTISDVKSKKIPISALIVGGGLTLACIPLQKGVTLSGILCGMSIGVVMVIIGKVTDEQIGIGDGIIFCILGAGHGFVTGITVLEISLFLTAVTVALLLVFGKIEKKGRIAFMPFILTGYCLAVAGGMV